ncbi:MAG TPA: MarR family transcriptional regulator [Alphaproteobacteria bacterium]|nr:MarR family transcriptional regulator [Alphaproteobacteria bacterium]
MFNLAVYLPYLVNRAGVRLAEAFSDELEAYGVTLPMWRVMAALDHRDGQRVGRLAAMTSIEISTLSRLLAAMERKELLSRRRSETDARSVTVSLTDYGRGITDKIIPTALRYEEVALAGFSAAEVEALKAMLVRVFENLDALDSVASSGRRQIA